MSPLKPRREWGNVSPVVTPTGCLTPLRGHVTIVHSAARAAVILDK